MGASKEYRDFIVERLSQVTVVNTRAMFGGFGIYVDDAMFGLISSEDVFYMKVDDSNRPDYESLEMPQFHKMPYFQVPVEVLEDDDAISAWTAKSIDVGIQTKKVKKKKK